LRCIKKINAVGVAENQSSIGSLIIVPVITWSYSRARSMAAWAFSHWPVLA
jgi:hypothetical protein